jgi:hypothetical protein
MIYDMIWYTISYIIWYMIWCNMIWYDVWYDMIWHMMCYMIYGMIWYHMIWYMIWHQACTHNLNQKRLEKNNLEQNEEIKQTQGTWIDLEFVLEYVDCYCFSMLFSRNSMYSTSVYMFLLFGKGVMTYSCRHVHKRGPSVNQLYFQLVFLVRFWKWDFYDFSKILFRGLFLHISGIVVGDSFGDTFSFFKLFWGSHSLV